jgi:hypothetical protein
VFTLHPHHKETGISEPKTYTTPKFTLLLFTVAYDELNHGNSTEHRPSWPAHSHSDDQELPRTLMEPESLLPCSNSPSLDSNLSRLNPTHIHILLIILTSPKRPLLLGFQTNIFHTFLIFLLCGRPISNRQITSGKNLWRLGLYSISSDQQEL